MPGQLSPYLGSLIEAARNGTEWPSLECEKIRIGNIFINHSDGRGRSGPLEHSDILLTTSQADTTRALWLSLMVGIDLDVFIGLDK